MSFFLLVLDEIFEDQRKQGCDKSTSSKMKFKHLRPQCHELSNSHSLLSPVNTNPVTQPLSIAGLSTPSYDQLNINHQLLAHFCASNGQRHHARGTCQRTNRDDHSAVLERGNELSELVNQKLYRLRQGAVENREASRINKEPGQQTLKSEEDTYLRGEGTRETEGLCDSEKVVFAKKALKKHKIK